jgi:hypothetical protein
MPRYADYHRTIVGYHGTKRETARRIIQGEADFDPSENDDDWLGHGVYFWEYAPQQAWLWANQRRRSQGWDDEIAVVGSMIRLGVCFDLLDPENVKDLGLLYQAFLRASRESNLRPPTNVRSKKILNCRVFNFTYEWYLDARPAIDTFRTVFVPTTKTDRIWKGIGINAHAHIQVCVRNPDCILGTWLVKPVGGTEYNGREDEPEELIAGEPHSTFGPGDQERPGGETSDHPGAID